MDLLQIFVLTLLSTPFMRFVPSGWRPWGLLVGSIVVVAWFFADGMLGALDLVLVAGSVVMTVVVWSVVRVPPDGSEQSGQQTREDRLAMGLMVGVLLFLVAYSLVWGDPSTRYLILTGTGMLGVAAAALPVVFSPSADQDKSTANRTALFLILLIILILVIIKIPATASLFGFALDWQAPLLTMASPFVWLGISYMAFRLIAVLLDFRAGRLPKEGIRLRDMAVYVLFFPAFTAGPIDRAQRFILDLQSSSELDTDRFVEGTGRILVGVFKKFVVADSLAFVAMSPTLVEQTTTTSGLWLLLYVYALQIYLDFSGYSDVAIGLGRLYGIKLPENFDRPYTQRNIQQFWQRWHITLSTWFRIYFFTPLSRALIRSRYKLPQWSIVLICQLATMTLIGLWHGATLNFALWGLWHGVGLFVHKTIADNTKGWHRRVTVRTWSRRLSYGFSVLITFHFIALGWVFFALPDTPTALNMLARLVGLN
ncbi:MAG: MBOAT family O-acyltransferase [Chloroflexota bacterium]